MQQQKMISLKKRKGNIYLSALSRVAPHGPWLDLDPDPQCFSADIVVDKLGLEILKKLEYSKWSVEEPKDFSPRNNDAPLLKIADVKNWKEFELPDTLSIPITQYSGGKIEFIPTSNERVKKGKGGGFIYFGPEKYVKIVSDDPSDIGKAALEALRRSE